jgi:hypothetical protein
MSWMHFDFRFGESRETIAERFLRDPLTAQLMEPGPSLVRELSLSYFSFYEIIESGPGAVTVDELVTGRQFMVIDIPELYEIGSVPGEIFFSRLVGPQHRAIFFTTPYIFGPEGRTQFERALRIQEEEFRLSPAASRFPPERYFAESQRQIRGRGRPGSAPNSKINSAASSPTIKRSGGTRTTCRSCPRKRSRPRGESRRS